MLVDLQFNAATTPWPVLRDAAVAAESAGFGGLWVFDHLAGSSVNGTSMLEAFTLLGALAASTERITLGTLVLNVYNRQPAIVAVGGATAQAIAGRPVLIGLGAGSSPSSPWSAEMRATGQEVEPLLPRRHARVERVIAVCRSVWSADRDESLATFPLPAPPPQLHVGVRSLGLARIAGRCADGVNVAWADPRRFELLDAARAQRADSADGLADLVASTYAVWDEGLLDPSHPERQSMDAAGVSRLILVVRHPDPPALAAAGLS